MLVLSRKKNQTVVIDGQIEIEILKIKGNTVRLGISAPGNVKVLRGELAPFEIELKTSELKIGDLAGESHPSFDAPTLAPLTHSCAVAHLG